MRVKERRNTGTIVVDFCCPASVAQAMIYIDNNKTVPAESYMKINTSKVRLVKLIVNFSKEISSAETLSIREAKEFVERNMEYLVRS